MIAIGKLCFVSSLLVTLFSFCTPYDSDKVNYRLIQGTWILADSEHDNSAIDTVKVDYSKEKTLLVFEEGRCVQLMPDLKDTINFTYQIKSFDLRLYRDDVPNSTFNITLLTADSLILTAGESAMVYIKERQ